jgi:hypothetical protein
MSDDTTRFSCEPNEFSYGLWGTVCRERALELRIRPAELRWSAERAVREGADVIIRFRKHDFGVQSRIDAARKPERPQGVARAATERDRHHVRTGNGVGVLIADALEDQLIVVCHTLAQPLTRGLDSSGGDDADGPVVTIADANIRAHESQCILDPTGVVRIEQRNDRRDHLSLLSRSLECERERWNRHRGSYR